MSTRSKRALTAAALLCAAFVLMGAADDTCFEEDEAVAPAPAATEPSAAKKAAAAASAKRKAAVAEAAPEPTPGIGDRVTVGNLELTVLSVEAYDAAQHNMFNDGTTRVQVRVRKHKGDEYEFSLFSEFTLIDRDGVGYDADSFCAECPENVLDLTLYGEAAVQRFVYFEVPGGVVPVSLRYEPGLSFTDAVFIALR